MKLHAGRTEDVGRIQSVFQMVHRELRDTTDLAVQDAVMHHVNMVHDAVAVLQEVLQR